MEEEKIQQGEEFKELNEEQKRVCIIILLVGWEIRKSKRRGKLMEGGRKEKKQQGNDHEERKEIR